MTRINHLSSVQFHGTSTSQREESGRLGDDDLFLIGINGVSRTITYSKLKEQLLDEIYKKSLHVGSMAYENKTAYAKVGHKHSGEYNTLKIGSSTGDTNIFEVKSYKDNLSLTTTYQVKAYDIRGQLPLEPLVGTIKFVYGPKRTVNTSSNDFDGWVNADGGTYFGIQVPNLCNFFKISPGEKVNILNGRTNYQVGVKNHLHPQNTISNISIRLRDCPNTKIQTHTTQMGQNLHKPHRGKTRNKITEVPITFNAKQITIPPFQTAYTGDSAEPKPAHCILRAMVYVGHRKKPYEIEILPDPTDEEITQDTTGMTSVKYKNNEQWFGDVSSTDQIPRKTDAVEVTFGDKITQINAKAFQNCTSLTSITTLENTKTICDSAFMGCTGLVNVIIPDVTSIQKKAFSGCTSLVSFEIPDGVTRIEESTFSGCKNLETIDILGNLTYIGTDAFKSCIKLPSFTIPQSVKTIANRAFWYCLELTTVSIGNGVTSIGESAFEDCKKLTSVTIPNSVTTLGAYAFCGCVNLATCTIGSGVRGIGSSTFNGTKITSITIPPSVNTIGDFAFSNCEHLATVTFQGESTLNSIGEKAFYNCCELKTITIGFNVKNIGSQAFGGNCGPNLTATFENRTIYDVQAMENYSFGLSPNNIITQEIADGVSFVMYTIDSGLPSWQGTITNISQIPNKDKARTVHLGSGVKKIESSAFKSCEFLTEIIFPDTVTEIEDHAFQYCKNLVSIRNGDKIKKIGNYAFSSCLQLKTFNIGPNLKTLGKQVFIRDSSLENFTISASNKNFQVKNGLLLSKDGKTLISGVNGPASSRSVTIPDGVTTIKEYAFFNMNGISSVSIPDSLKKIEEGAFNQCSGLKSVVFSGTSNLTTIGESAFMGPPLDNTPNFVIPSNVTSLGKSCFYGCYITSLTIPDGVSKIPDRAFYGMGELLTVVIGKGVTKIASDAFGCYGQSKVTSATFKGKTLEKVKKMANYPWGLPTAAINVS